MVNQFDPRALVGVTAMQITEGTFWQQKQHVDPFGPLSRPKCQVVNVTNTHITIKRTTYVGLNEQHEQVKLTKDEFIENGNKELKPIIFVDAYETL